uniref:Cilia- and flagella-associated protein 299 n=1 Tax=Sinocyclocheilus anshuiensis TaxID=1608454 RepID=A0A671L5S9_9TELE
MFHKYTGLFVQKCHSRLSNCMVFSYHSVSFNHSQLSRSVLLLLQDQELARQLVELGHKGSSLEREEFETRKAAAEASRLASGSQQKGQILHQYVTLRTCIFQKLASTGKELKDNFLRALAEWEEANRSGKMTSIIFIRDRNSHGQEISGYIDYSHRLKFEDFEPYFSGKKRLMPKATDLSFYNWGTQVAKHNASSNYEVITENSSGLLFRCKNDRKILNVDPEVSIIQPQAPTRHDLIAHVDAFLHTN